VKLEVIQRDGTDAQPTRALSSSPNLLFFARFCPSSKPSQREKLHKNSRAILDAIKNYSSEEERKQVMKNQQR
jgi:hypothetical protein